jgi:hypothetical protein
VQLDRIGAAFSVNLERRAECAQQSVSLADAEHT